MENTNQSPLSDQQDIDAGKTIAILSYITLIGWIVAIVMHTSSNPKSRFAAFHLRQSLGLFITLFAAIVTVVIISIIMPFLFFLIPLIQLGVVILVILQIINAVNGKKQGLPLLGDFFEKILSGIK